MKLWSVLLLLGVLVWTGCGTFVRWADPVAEIPAGAYEVRVLSALVPTRPADGEVTAAVIYTRPGDPPVEVWQTPHPGGLYERSLGMGTGREHLGVIRSPENYETVVLRDREGRPLVHGVLHREVPASLQEVRGKPVVFLSVIRFLDFPPDGDVRNGGIP